MVTIGVGVLGTAAESDQQHKSAGNSYHEEDEITKHMTNHRSVSTPVPVSVGSPIMPSASANASSPSRRKSTSSQSGRNRLRKRQAGGRAAAGAGGMKSTKAEGGTAQVQLPASALAVPSISRTSASTSAKTSSQFTTGRNAYALNNGVAERSFGTTKPAIAAEKASQGVSGGIDGVAVPRIVIRDEMDRSDRGTMASGNGSLQHQQPQLTPASAGSMKSSGSIDDDDHQRITTAIPTGSLDDLYDESKLQFSKRGSLLVNDQKLRAKLSVVSKQQQLQKQSSNYTGQGTDNQNGIRNNKLGITPSRRVLSEEEIMLSKKIRAMYEYGDEYAGKLAVGLDGLDGDASSDFAVTKDGQDAQSSRPGSPLDLCKPRKMVNLEPLPRPASGTTSRRCSMITKTPSELAGGIEDWAEVNAKNVDRYGFIVTPSSTYSTTSVNSHTSMDMPQASQVSTALKMVSEAQRQKPSLRLTLSSQGKRKKTDSLIRDRRPSDAKSHTSRKAPASIRSYQSDSTAFTAGFAHSQWWQATNHLLHNRRKRVVDEAGDMLTLPVGYRGSLSAGSGGVTDDERSVGDKRGRTRCEQEARLKEWRREEKWQKMAHLITRGGSGGKGGGMDFEFDIHDPKVVNRVWKGIPDRWRASAWYCFLAESAKKKSGSASHAELVERFNELQDENCADDSQIDVDVPRTISSHIMFRRRYRGGQRLLFRVLHAVSLYFPETGYVQGMASLAATLLCYYDEENTFIMLVRMWQLRGLKHLYESGFGGLMEALDQFERDWLRDGEVAKKLGELGISSTAYGTRWYLTLFNYSIPFSSQLRVWDVFMLLGDPSLNPGNSSDGYRYNHSVDLNSYEQNSFRANGTANDTNNDKQTPLSRSSNRPNTSASIATNAPTSKSNFMDCDLDVLHATSAALIDASRDILVDADFENVMKVLTSWVPIQDEDLFMRVVKTEWKERKRRVGKAAL